MPIGTLSPEKFVEHLEGAHWPATKQDLLETARSNAAPPEVVESIARLRGTRFGGPRELMIAYEEGGPEREDAD